MKEEIVAFLKGLQTQICEALEVQDGNLSFGADKWERAEGGGGITQTAVSGNIIEKGGVGFSEVMGVASEGIKRQLNIVEDLDFLATGVSLVMHPSNPFVPIIHMNVRYFELSNGVFWFGGGIDLTPHYVDAGDAAWFHTQLKKASDSIDIHYYDRHKKWADDYFYIPHRAETRGVGGIFYDYLGKDGKDKNKHFDHMKAIGNAFVPIYTHLMAKNAHLEYTETHKLWQKLRRGRYAEFNLVWDRGTKFGLESNGRTESILMSLPPEVNWHYNFQPELGSKESETLGFLHKGINWINQ